MEFCSMLSVTSVQASHADGAVEFTSARRSALRHYAAIVLGIMKSANAIRLSYTSAGSSIVDWAAGAPSMSPLWKRAE